MKAHVFFISLIALFLASCSSNNPEWSADTWTSLLEDKAQNAWKLSENASIDFTDSGMILSGTQGTLLFTGDTTQNFEVNMAFDVPENATAFFYFNAHEGENGNLQGYNIQMHNTRGATPKTGSLKDIRNIYIPFEKKSASNHLKMQLVGKTIQVWLNGALVVHYTEPETPYRTSETKEMRIRGGLFGIAFNSNADPIRIAQLDVKLPGTNTETEETGLSADYIRSVTKLHTAGYPMVDYHIHLKGSLTMEEALAHAAATGINYGIAVNCGQDFPINTEAKLDSFFNSLTPEPVFYAMQAEGREWLDLFSPTARDKFDYVFTDAMTYTEDDGNRVHLWKPEEVHIQDPQQFMDFYVTKITEVMQEPVDIFVNPTFLPEVIKAQYDALWTDERMEKVIKAAVENNVVMEINCRYRIPSYRFLKKGKEMGLRFSCGTNNTDSNIGKQEYFIHMIDSCGLEPGDLFYPELQ